MKNKIYYLGVAVLMLISASCMFKIMHGPGANIMFVAGILLLCFAFIPAAFINSLRAEENKTQKKLYILTALVLIISFLGLLFKIMRWPGGNEIILISLPLPFILVLPAYLFSYRKENEINYRNFLAIFFFFAYFAAISALLALGVSRNVTDGYVRSALNNEQKTEMLSFQCRAWQSNTLSNTADQETRKRLQQTCRQADSVCEAIDKTVISMIKGGYDYKSEIFLTNNKPDLWQIKYKDAGIGEWITGDLHKLKSDIIAYKKILFASSESITEPSPQFDTLLDTDDTNEINWESGIIKDKIVVSGIEQLYLLKYQVRFVEWEVISAVD